MNNKELLERASSEIKFLRAQNQAMATRLEIYDNMMLLFTSSPRHSGTGLMSPDIVYELDQTIDRVKKDEAKERAVERQEKY